MTVHLGLAARNQGGPKLMGTGMATGNPPSEGGTDNETRRLVVLARRILDPLARMLVGRLPYDTIARLLKEALVQAAREKLQHEAPAKRITKSSIALMTGIDSRTLEDTASPDDARSIHQLLNPYSLVLEVWSQHSKWQDPETGKPMVLPTYGPGKSFQTLVNRTVGRNISYSEIMETLLKARNIERVDNRHLVLRERLFNAPQDVDMKALWFSANLSYCLGVNIQRKLETGPGEEATPNASLTTSQLVPEAALPELRAKMAELVVQHTNEVGETLGEHETEDTSGRRYSAGVGWFYFEEPFRDDGNGPG